ncbi:hypothetical protein M0R04_14485, partial [Candidatus Dojkabacteria bacterium]|nr:hypothetical protein [Candidatus Dojkabacteria bacterium]
MTKTTNIGRKKEKDKYYFITHKGDESECSPKERRIVSYIAKETSLYRLFNDGTWEKLSQPPSVACGKEAKCFCEREECHKKSYCDCKEKHSEPVKSKECEPVPFDIKQVIETKKQLKEWAVPDTSSEFDKRID